MPSPDPISPAVTGARYISEHLARTIKGNTITVAPDPISVPPLPEGAPREQLMEFGAVCGAATLWHAGARRVILAYLSRWHPDHEALR